MRGRICLLAVFFLFITLNSASALDNFHVALVEHVDGYGKYVSGSGEYQIGDNVQIYAQTEDINHNRAYAIDFVFIVYDPEDYPVAGTVISKKGADWTDRVYTVYQLKIPDGWKIGDYRVEVYIFDVLNSSATYESYKSFFDDLIKSGEARIEVSRIPRDEVDYLKKEIKFTVVYEIKSEIYLFDSGLKASVLPEGMNNTLQVSIFNKGNEKAEFYLNLLIDGEFYSKKKVELKPHEATRVEFTIPQLEIGDHRLDLIPEWGNFKKESILPIYVEPYLFNKPLMIGSLGNGTLVLSLNNYVLGSGGVTGLDEKEPKFYEEKRYYMNRDNAAKTLTNIIAYVWGGGNHNGTIKIGLYYRSDSRVDSFFGKLIDYIKALNNAPIQYIGVVSDYELEKADLVVYVTNTPEIKEIEDYVKNGGTLFVDVSDYYFDSTSFAEMYKLRNATELLRTFYDFTTINKTVSIKIKTELKLPPELKYSNLTVSDFIVDVGKAVKISFDVKNEGGAGIADVFVRINNEIVFNQSVSMFQGEKKHIEFEYVPEKEGSYKILLDDTSISKVFFAKNATKEKEAVKTPPPSEKRVEKRDPTLITILAAILGILIILRMYLRK